MELSKASGSKRNELSELKAQRPIDSATMRDRTMMPVRRALLGMIATHSVSPAMSMGPL